MKHLLNRIRAWWNRPPVDLDRLDGVGTPIVLPSQTLADAFPWITR